MPESMRRLILANGERYVEPIQKTQGFGKSELPREYGEARSHVMREIGNALEHFSALPARKRLKDEAVLCLRLHPDMMAKSYDPQSIFDLVPELENVGSRNYLVATEQVAKTKRIKKQLENQLLEVTGRLVFVRSSDAGFRRLLRVLDQEESSLPVLFRREISTIEKFDLLSPDEQLAAFQHDWKDWKEGRVEIVLHPSRHSESEQTHFLSNLFHEHNVVCGRPNIAYYEKGPLFISCHLTRKALDAISGANPLRTAQPLMFGGFETLRSSKGFSTPFPPNVTTRSIIKVGMFDGGVDVTHPLLQGHAEEDVGLSIKTKPWAEGIAHGTAVAGSLLYGPLNDYDTAQPLPAPPVSVVSFRVLPTSNPTDIDLYEAVDIIEAAVPSRKDIKVYNISVGPRGPILDDTISRFTYALDLLAATHKVTFCVAVGNDGEEGPGLNRVQSPSDLVNGLGVGAYTERKSVKVHAPYSCQGPGRECAKLKPDVVAFGGCDQNPIHLISVSPGEKALSYGTSFSSPITASLCSQAAESFDRSTALLGRTLLIHTAEHPNGKPDHLLGHGIVSDDIDELLQCDEKTVTIVFQGDLPARKSVKLPILLPPNLVMTGTVTVRWTVAALPPVAPNHPFDYTAMCIEDTFYPNNHVFTYSPRDIMSTEKPCKLHTHNDAVDIKKLLARGWKKSALPVSDSGNKYQTEGERRSKYKWETIVRRETSKRATSLDEPFLVLHTIPRHGVSSRLDYVAIVTIAAPKFSGDLYDAVVKRFTALQQVRVRTQTELRVRI